MNKAKLPTHIEIDASAYGIEKDSVILLEQLRTIDVYKRQGQTAPAWRLSADSQERIRPLLSMTQ